MTFDQAVDYYAEVAQRKGWFAEARHRVHAMDADESGQYRGIRAAVAARLGDFKPAADELGEWWVIHIAPLVAPAPTWRKR